MNSLTQVIVWLNTAANALGRVFDFVAYLPGWASATIISVITGVVMLVAFKHTSNQAAIKRVRRGIKANLLSVKLFKDNIGLAIRAQFSVLFGALRLLLLALVPMVVMLVPMVLLLGQLALWYQKAPLKVGAETVITVQLNSEAGAPLPEVELEPSQAVNILVGPIRVPSQRELTWAVQAREAGDHALRFRVNGQEFTKQIAIGTGFMRVSERRPEWDWSEVLLHPGESPFRPDSLVQSIDIEFPDRDSWTSGTDNWVIYLFVVSLVAGFLLRKPLKVNL